MELDVFISKQLELLELEREADIEETRGLREGVPSKELERQGVCIRRLRIGSKRSGLYGRTLVKFEPQWVGKQLPAHNLTSGDIVGVTSVGCDFGHRDVVVSGVVWSTGHHSVTVAFDLTLVALPLEDQLHYGLIKLANDVTYRRIRLALGDLLKFSSICSSRLIDVLFEKTEPSEPLSSLSNDILIDDKLKFLNTDLDESQQNAVEFALRQRELAIIHGPPGTGKTTTVVEIIRQSVAQGLKVLACAPSNVAVDNLVEKLSACGTKIVRLGHLARSLSTTRDVSLDALVSKSDNAALANDIRNELDKIQLEIRKTSDKRRVNKLRYEMKSLSYELRKREIVMVKEVLKTSDVVLATLTSSYNDGPLKQLADEHFDVVIIDECSQALEAACWIALVRAPKCILAGDHLQLPPTIISKEAAKGGFEVTLMERLLDRSVGKKCVRMLTTQYRMNEVIMKWPSQQLYDDKLVAHPSVKGHLLCDLPDVTEDENTSIPLLLIDTAGCDLYEIDVEGENSKGNEGEAKLVAIHVEQLVASGVNPKDIAVVTPYNLQVEFLRSLLLTKYQKLEIKSVDGFQGREKESVVLSLVRSNEKGIVGFLSEDRRLNVAITRARRHLAVVCDSDTVSRHSFLKDLVSYLNSDGEIRSAHQYQNEMGSSSLNKADLLQHKKSAVHHTQNTKTTVKERNKKKNRGLKQEKQKNSEPSLPSVIVKTTKREEELFVKYRTVLEEFSVNEESKSQTFPSNLTSYERRIVHEVSEKLGLIHISKDDGDQRCIVVSKRDISKEPEKQTVSKQVEKVKIEPSFFKTANENVERKAVKSVSETKINISNSQSCETGNADVSKVTAGVKTKKKKTESKKVSSSNDVTSNETDDEFLNRMVRNNKKCAFPKCKIGTTILKQVCSLCNMSFCYGHFVPEVHGCGEAARAVARERIRKEGTIVPGSGLIDRKPKPQKRAQLEKILDKKMNEFSQERSRKTKKNDK